jgi:PAS domain-containing protein
MFGLPIDQFPKTVEEFAAMSISGRSRAGSTRQSPQAVAQGKEFDNEFRIVRPDSSVRSLVARGKVYFDEAGPPNRLTGVTWDVTEQPGGRGKPARHGEAAGGGRANSVNFWRLRRMP